MTGKTHLTLRTAATDIVGALEQAGTDYIFGVPGDTSLALYEALRRSPTVTHVMARDERGASFMADVYARISGKVGVCEAPSGAGALYLIPGIAEATASSIPVLALTTDVPLASQGRNVLTEMDQVGLFSSLTKSSTVLRSPARAAEVVRSALRTATSGRPGACHISLPEDVLATPLTGEPPPAASPAEGTFPSSRTGPDPGDAARAAEMILAARRPAFVAGGGVLVSQAWEELTALAESVGAMVGTSINGKGSIDETHPNSLGVVGGNGSRPYANQAIRDADLVVFIGCKTDSVTTMKWRLPSPGEARVIQIDVDPEELGRNYPLQVGLAGDAKVCLSLLTGLVAERDGGRRRPWLDTAPLREAWWTAQQPALLSDARPIKPPRLIDALVRLLPREAIVVADAGTGTPLTAAFLPSPAGRSVVIPRGFGGLGYALPGVVGAALARPGVPVVGLVGDGSFAMAVGDLETISRLDLPVLLIQFNNSTFGWIKALQRFHCDERYFSVDFSGSTDYVGIAHGFGLDGVRVEDPADIEGAIKTGLAERRPFFIDVVTESEESEPPPVPDWQ